MFSDINMLGAGELDQLLKALAVLAGTCAQFPAHRGSRTSVRPALGGPGALC